MPLAGGTAPLPNCHHLGPITQVIAFPEELEQMKHAVDRYCWHTGPFCWKISFFHKEAMNAKAESKSVFPHFISVWPTKWGDGGNSFS